MTSMKLLRAYHYDPLDRLTGETSAGRASTQRFYQEDDLVTEVGDQVQLTILRHGEEPLAQHRTASGVDDTTLLATDRAHSVLQTLAGTNRHQMVYTAYGHRTGESGLSSLLGFNGEAPDAITGHYLLGQGTRAFNPVLMRFNSPDELSPFDSGGVNPYAYCGGDPINRYDPTGKYWQWIRFLGFHHYDAGMNLINNKISVIVKNPINHSRYQKTTKTNLATAKPFEYDLPPVKKHPSRVDKPKSVRGKQNRTLINDAIRYDEIKNSNDITTVATEEMKSKYRNATEELSRLPKTKDTSSRRHKLKQIISWQSARIKQLSVFNYHKEIKTSQHIRGK
ncbi:RHS repeat-associated core domain-containing protein [Pseudomonas sp. PDM31]|nr:RHS repeat-associated core domain-containing protein [Pseudomonas sp. PDM31]MBV7477457.1 RHS repeat-associated core domain-containing protein [Pseudomonas sp. PDM31]